MFVTTTAHDGRDNNFHLVRLAAAASVILTHSFSTVTGEYYSQPLARVMNHSIGQYAVDVFFVLSGFLVTQSLAKDGDLLRFAVSRFLRIFPGLATAVLATALLLGPLVSDLPLRDYFSDGRLFAYIAGALTTVSSDHPLPGVFEALPETARVNDSLWTLKYELIAYGSLFMIAAFSLKTGLRSFLACSGGLLLVYVAGRTLLPWPEATTPLSNVMHFLLSFYFGVGAYFLRARIPLSILGVAALSLCMLVAQDTEFREFFEMLWVAYCALWVAFVPNLGRAFVNKVGDYSFGLYIYAFPVQQTIRLLYPDIDILGVFVFGLLLTLPLAIASWHCVEGPCLRRRNSIVTAIRRRFVSENQVELLARSEVRSPS